MTQRRLTGLDFAPWIEHVFSHDVRASGGAWYHDADCDDWDGPATLTVAHLTRLFADPVPPLRHFSDGQIAQGLWYIIDSGAGGLVLSLIDESVPLAARLGCIESIGSLFELLLEPRVAPVLGHIDEAGAEPLNSITYMWWDVFPVAAQADRDDKVGPIHAAIIRVMDSILQSRHPAIQESALHGLGHWAYHHSGEVARIVDAYLAREPNLRPALLNYARSAKVGCVL